MNTDLAIQTPSTEQDGFKMQPRTLEEAMKFCEIMANSDLVPNCYKGKPGNIMVAIQMGNELGMTPMRALRSIAVINGRASIWGDDMLAMVLASPVCEYVDESESTDTVGVCKTKRKTCAEQVSRFTLEDAKRAGLLGKQGSWQTNTSRMLKLRARGFGLRDTFADVLAGLVSAEEALDLPSTAPDTVPEPPHLVSLKEKLKAKVLEVQTDVPAEESAAASSSGEHSPIGGTVGEPLTRDLETGNQSTEGQGNVKSEGRTQPPTNTDDPAEPYRAKIRTAHDTKAVNAAYQACPEELRQDCYTAYTLKLKSLKGK